MGMGQCLRIGHVWLAGLRRVGLMEASCKRGREKVNVAGTRVREFLIK
jgi:hypothetical protein